jgi:hypothetical protein
MVRNLCASLVSVWFQEVKGSKTEGAALLFVESLGYNPFAIREVAVSMHHHPSHADGVVSDLFQSAPRVLKQVCKMRS